MKYFLLAFFAISLLGCGSDSEGPDIASDVVGSYLGNYEDSDDNLLEGSVTVEVTKVSNNVVRIEPPSSSSMTSFEVEIISNAGIVTSIGSGADVVFAVNLTDDPVSMGFDYSNGNSFIGLKVN